MYQIHQKATLLTEFKDCEETKKISETQVQNTHNMMYSVSYWPKQQISSGLRNEEIEAVGHIAKFLDTGTGRELWPFL